MVSREKTLAAAFQAPPEMPFPAFYGGYLDADLRDCVHSTAYGSFGSWGWFRMPPASVLLPHLGGYGRSVEGVVSDALCFCFAAAAVSKEWCQALSNCQGAAAKKERRSVRTGPGVSFRSRENTGGKTHGYYQSKTLVTGAASVPGEARNAAARAFFSYTIKRRILFFLSRKKRMGVLPRGGAASLRASPALLLHSGTGRKTKGAASAAPLFSGYIFSGASTPMSFRPFFSTIRAQSASFRRAAATWGSSPLMRQAV